MKIRILILIFAVNILIAFFASCVTHKGCPACNNNNKPYSYAPQKSKAMRKALKSKNRSTATGNGEFKPAWDNNQKKKTDYTNEYKDGE